MTPGRRTDKIDGWSLAAVGASPIEERSHARRPLALAVGLSAVLAAPLAPAAEPEKNEKNDKKKWDVNAPPGEAATVSLDVRTGTWMSVDASPDGKTLVFDLLGDLYTLPVEGGEAKALTHSIAWDMQPRFSPDGKRIAYVSDAGGGDNVWVMNADGTGARAVSTEDFRLVNNPVWHPSGDYVAARKHYSGTRSLGSGEIWLYHASGGKGVALNEKPNWQKDLGEPAFSPDGRYVYFSQDTTPGRTFEYNKNSHEQIYVVQRLDTTDGTIEPFVTGPGGAVRPVPSPDGRLLAFVRRVGNQSTLFVKDLATGEERPVWGGLERDLQEAWAIHGVYPGFAWLPGAREVVVWAQGKLWRVDVASGKAREIPFHVKDTREVRKAVRFTTAVAPDTFDVRQLRWATVFPAGDRVVYSALGHLYVEDLPGGTPRRLTTQSRPLRAVPERLARRAAHRVRDLGRPGVRQRPHDRRRHRPRDAADEAARQVPRAPLLARRAHGRLHALARRLPHVALAGHRDRRLPRRRGRHGRRRRA